MTGFLPAEKQAANAMVTILTEMLEGVGSREASGMLFAPTEEEAFKCYEAAVKLGAAANRWVGPKHGTTMDWEISVRKTEVLFTCRIRGLEG